MAGLQSITVELDDETIRDLTALGEPVAVITRLAHSAADGVRRPGHPRREGTDASLRDERFKADIIMAKEREAIAAAADDVLRVARRRAERLVQTAREDAEGRGLQAPATEARAERARAGLEHERLKADAALQTERADADVDRSHSLTAEREATDRSLTSERTEADTLIGDQREANANMLSATVQADAAKARAEESESALRAVAEFREMFIGMLGHDLRTPLASIVTGAAVLLRRGALSDPDGVTVSRIIRSSQRMTRMITQLLDLTRARLGGGLPIEPTPTDLREVCRNVVTEFAATIQLEVEGDVTGTWDSDRLSEVLSNLAGNAVDFAAAGTSVIVKAYAEAAGVVVEVSNQGPPIPASVHPFIFEPFRRAEQHEKSPSGNLGLGLYIAKQIVLSHGGTLDGHSADGTTTFVMRLPRHAPPPPPPAPC